MSGRAILRDPLAERLIGPGKPFDLVEEKVGGRPRRVFAGAPRTLSAIYRAAADTIGDVVVSGEGRFSYADVFARAGALAAVLRDRYGVGRGDMVALAMENRPEFVVAFVAITAAGACAALVNSRGVADEMLHAIALTGARLLVTDAPRAAAIAEREADPAFDRIVLGETTLRPERDIDFATACAGVAPLEPIAVGPADGAVILFTSGTTGFPKGALLSHGAIAHAAALSKMVGTMQDLRYEEETGIALPDAQRSMSSPTVILAPMFHMTGVLPIVRTIHTGGTIHILGKWNVDVAFDMLETTGLARLSFVPAMLWDMFRSPRATPEMLSRIRFMVNGGAPLAPDLVAEIKRRTPHCLIVNTYGQSEDSGWACSISGRTYVDNPQSCGWAVPSVDVIVRRDDGSAADIGEPGELWVASAAVMTEYLSNADATREALQDGWLATGDVGIVDADGLFTIVDRKKNMVISGGENIYCAEVERVVSAHPSVRESIAYGLPDARLGERMVVEAVIETGADLTADDVRAHCREHLAIYKVPRAVLLLNEALPRTASGKIDRRRIVAHARSR
ncbi:AMP-binding protein [uncultured Sphingomonas sp.]|uniref:class I adenylate-forming enzyme family protein n=1 Tax=uncultured Sphingomonas sp. TaxID=158754 RepID=UPI00262C9D3C|nr:AMP-binding protein [uncultured Sphingomonas sp.]